MFTLDYRTPIGGEEMMWSFYSKGKWLAKGVVKFPQVRVTYPAVHLKDRAVYLVGSTDPVPGGSIRDYQQMFFTWSDDVTTGASEHGAAWSGRVAKRFPVIDDVGTGASEHDGYPTG